MYVCFSPFSNSIEYRVNTKNFYDDLDRSSDLIGGGVVTADIPKDHPCDTAVRKKAPGYFFDETNGDTLTKCIAIRAKLYSYKIDRAADGEIIKAKGVGGHVIRDCISFDKNKQCLFTR